MLMWKKKNKNKNSCLGKAEESFGNVLQISRYEQKDIERLFARVFSTEKGQKLLAYLHYITFQRALGANASDKELRYSEGQRALVMTILRLIERGRKG